MAEFDYASMSFTEIVSQIRNRLKNDPRFANFNESAIAQTIIEIFAGVGDLNNYYIERRAEENFLSTARLKSSIISHVKGIGYAPIRPIPSKADTKIILKGPLPNGLVAGMKITFDSSSVNLKFNGFNFILSKTYQYTITQSDIDNGVGNKNFSKVLEYSVNDINNVDINDSGNIDPASAIKISILQGEYKTFELKGDSAIAKPGLKFQRYNLDDKEFSNYYGDEDKSFDYTTGLFDLDVGYTKVGIGANESDAFLTDNLFEIARRAIITQKTTLDAARTIVIPKVCLIETEPNQTVTVSFGDNIFATLGLTSTNQSIFVRYLATKGSASNRIGVKDQKITSSNSFTADGIDVTNNIEFRFNGNITGGADFESIESMKQNAPGIYSALDRLVTTQDYVTYLRSLTSPIDVKNALAWGEQEELKIRNKTAIKDLFNVVLYSVVGSLYNISDNNFVQSSVRKLDDINEPVTLFANNVDILWGQGFDYYLLNRSALTAIANQEQLDANNHVTIVNNMLNKKGAITTRAYSISPIIQYFNLCGKVYINKLQPLDSVKRKINNALFNFFDTHADFNVPVYKSNIIEIIESFKEVTYVDVKLSAMDLGNNAPEIKNLKCSDTANDKFFTEIADVSIKNNLTTTLDTILTNNWFNGPKTVEVDTVKVEGSDFTNYNSTVTRIPVEINNYAVMSESSFWNDLVPALHAGATNLGIETSNWANGNQFQSFITALNCSFKPFLVTNMLDSNGNIVNYTLRQEIPAINISNDIATGLIYTYGG